MIVERANFNSSGQSPVKKELAWDGAGKCQFSTVNSGLERTSLLLIWPPWIQNAIFTLTRKCRCKLWTNKLETWDKLKFVSAYVYIKPKLRNARTVFSSPIGGQPDEPSKWAASTTARISQFQQCRNSGLSQLLLSPWSKFILYLSYLHLDIMECCIAQARVTLKPSIISGQWNFHHLTTREHSENKIITHTENEVEPGVLLSTIK